MRRTVGWYWIGLGVGAAVAAQAAPLSVAQVVERVREAVAVEEIGPAGIELSGSAEFLGNRVPHTLWIDGRGRFEQRWEGPVTAAEGFDGQTAWARDFGGEVRHLAFTEAARVELSAQVLGHGWLSPTATLELEGLASGPDDAVTLTFRRRDGFESGEVEIDAETWRPRAWTLRSWRGEERFELEGALPGEGTWLPAVIRRTDHEGKVRVTTLEARGTGPAGDRRGSAPAVALPADTRFDPEVSPELEVERGRHGHLLVRPVINGRPLGWFVFDSGAGATVLDSRSVAELELTPVAQTRARGVGGAVDAPVFRVATLEIGPLTVTDHVVVGLDLSFLDRPMGRRISGVIGYGVLARTVVALDMKEGVVALHDPASFDGAELPWVPMLLDERLPVVAGRSETGPAQFRIDTGSNAVITLHQRAVAEEAIAAGGRTRRGRMQGVGGRASARRVELPWLEVAGHRRENVEADYPTGETVVFTNPYTTGTLGGGWLEPYRLVLDYPGSRLAMTPRR